MKLSTRRMKRRAIIVGVVAALVASGWWLSSPEGPSLNERDLRALVAGIQIPGAKSTDTYHETGASLLGLSGGAEEYREWLVDGTEQSACVSAVRAVEIAGYRRAGLDTAACKKLVGGTMPIGNGNRDWQIGPWDAGNHTFITVEHVGSSDLPAHPPAGHAYVAVVAFRDLR